MINQRESRSRDNQADLKKIVQRIDEPNGQFHQLGSAIRWR